MQDVKREELQKALAFVVKKYRNDKSISQLSNEIGLSKSIWSDVERGKKDIQFSTFCRIAEALEVKPSLLIQEIEEIIGNDFSFLE